MEPDGWVRVVVHVEPGDAELATDLLWGFDPAAIEQQDEASAVVLLAGFADPAAAHLAADALGDRGLGHAAVVPVDDDGLDGWRPWARPVAAGPFLLVPSWLATDEPAASDAPDAPDAPARIRLLVDPGRTFGSGSHPTTRLVLARLAELVRPGHRVLDVGCGSGILAVGAALTGAATALGIDVDPDAPAATHANARANHVADRVTASTTPLADVVAQGERYDLVLANLLAPVVIDLALDLAAAIAPGGHLVVSGLLADRWEPAVTAVLDAAEPTASLTVGPVDHQDGWVAVTLTRSA